MIKLITITLAAIILSAPVNKIFAKKTDTESSFKLKTKKIVINTEADAKIYVDGKLIGNSTTTIKVEPYASVNVRVEKIAFITQERNYINDKSHDLPKTDFVKLERDDAYENSTVTNVANKDIDVRTTHGEDTSWKLINRIITDNFDVIAVTDKTTGYMCTAWAVKSFHAATVRTRLVIKTSNSETLTYKAKLVSEIAPPGTSGNADESFKPWDRILRSYENVIVDLQSRLTK
jgi:hypothetical protein